MNYSRNRCNHPLCYGEYFRALHSVSKETHNKFIGSPCDPGSMSGDPRRVIFFHENLKQVAKIHYKIHLSTLFRKRNTTFHGAFLLRMSVLWCLTMLNCTEVHCNRTLPCIFFSKQLIFHVLSNPNIHTWKCFYGWNVFTFSFSMYLQ